MLSVYSLQLRFLSLFEDSKDKGKDALKFAATFTIMVRHEDTVSVGRSEDYFPIGKILAHHGQSVSDFKTVKDAIKAVRHLCKLNKAEFGFEEKPEGLDEVYPQFSKFWYVFSAGKTTTNTSTQSKELEQSADLKNIKQLEQAKIFMEGLGFNGDAVADTTVTVANVKFDEVQKKRSCLRVPICIESQQAATQCRATLSIGCIYIYIYIYTQRLYTCIEEWFEPRYLL